MFGGQITRYILGKAKAMGLCEKAFRLKYLELRFLNESYCVSSKIIL